MRILYTCIYIKKATQIYLLIYYTVEYNNNNSDVIFQGVGDEISPCPRGQIHLSIPPSVNSRCITIQVT